MFDGEYIGIDDKNGKQLFCGDRVVVHEEYAEDDYNNPILDYDNGTFSLPEIKRIRKVNGVIRYDIDYCAFVFFPDKDGQTAYIPYVRKPIKDFGFVAVEKVN